jgi:hypothetical protein
VNQGVSGTDKKRNTPYSYMQSSKIPFYFAKQWMNNKGLFVAKGTAFTSMATRKTYKAGSKDSQAFAMARSWKESRLSKCSSRRFKDSINRHIQKT